MHPIHRVLSMLRSTQVRHLPMGGQACMLYGAAEFSRDTDVCLHADPENLARLQRALDNLQAERIAVPPFEAQYLLSVEARPAVLAALGGDFSAVCTCMLAEVWREREPDAYWLPLRRELERLRRRATV
jgi:hypothetical protein